MWAVFDKDYKQLSTWFDTQADAIEGAMRQPMDEGPYHIARIVTTVRAEFYTTAFGVNDA